MDVKNNPKNARMRGGAKTMKYYEITASLSQTSIKFYIRKIYEYCVKTVQTKPCAIPDVRMQSLLRTCSCTPVPDTVFVFQT